MSYAKAMKHSRNVRKCRMQSRMHFGFDTGSGSWPSGWGNPNVRPFLEIQEWFPRRHNGDKAYNRECIREAVRAARSVR